MSTLDARLSATKPQSGLHNQCYCKALKMSFKCKASKVIVPVDSGGVTQEEWPREGFKGRRADALQVWSQKTTANDVLVKTGDFQCSQGSFKVFDYRNYPGTCQGDGAGDELLLVNKRKWIGIET